ncbi:MAG: tripartite tricarboxylate transporter substrate binding protein [Betaproteobacteria bacterium]|nr:tripartite tricarboxylate transporter substrate binding protein [Betaproteobacteria bacterium]
MCAALAVATAARAAYPERPIRLIVPSAAGSSSDTHVRLYANRLTQQMGQPIVIDNRPGGGTTIATAAVASATPDGYTIGFGNVATLAVNKTLLQRPPPYDVDKDLQPVVQTHYQSNALVLAPSLQFQTVRDLVDYARKNPGKLLYGSGGNGSTPHLAAELLKVMTGMQMDHVPYKVGPQYVNDLAAARIHLAIPNIVLIAPHIKSGKVRGLAVTGLKRSSLLPTLPTVAESGVPGYEVIAWGGLIVPAGVPKAIIDRLNAEINKALDLPAFRAQFAALGSEPVGGSTEDFVRFIKAESEKWGNLIRRSKIKPD